MKKFEGFDREDLIVIGYYAGSFLIGAANAANREDSQDIGNRW